MRLAGKVFEDDNYRAFELLAFNRNVKKIKNLIRSMKKHGWINAYPMNVSQNGSGKFIIKDGHHRFEVAKMLGIPVKFIICNDESTVYELDQPVNKWTLEDHLVSYDRSGKPDYSRVRDYCERTGIGVIDATAMLVGNSAGTTSHAKSFKEGNFEVTDTTNANIVADIVLHCKKKGIKWAHTHNFVMALSRVVWLPEFSATRFKAKVTSFTYLVEKQPHNGAYLEMIEKIYNFKSSEKVPLKFPAELAAKGRAAA
ncbi:MAG TPA: hypothetical protein DDZ40_07385 [Deltaproteobacteria bacterium]|nr:hypothetical protein [Deltaproteobacteria bacterium]